MTHYHIPADHVLNTAVVQNADAPSAAPKPVVTK